ncbi:MAG: bifunctional adenosylcobinamide kinase/adenosylcobinamide-phosphate guanylyltransferase [Candidatus Omnitrophica bacterium CG11_big_fil_rev_8_21_14_0_20_42_13]|uniref:Adenosylcobinamide kinase n=1 Tax=Candidatus Ghiorseimicrobium undicola TaxID=1974746 RepID=A0A2H0M1S5_9BACT|nr:MAG: bifunctional adenosylcobinamide kinase/adenosylcobinamide-phosphate guanylyltransferase [Candidatus Omnitrophica bacterium CG11_big_fil_rev_8_21_14_0_20_42_13]
MGKITFILGGARSGKSTYALAEAKKRGSKTAFIATGEAGDDEMEERIATHKNQRPPHWQTFEEPKDIAALINRIGNDFDCLIIDCLTLLVSNLLLAKKNAAEIEEQINAVLLSLSVIKAEVLIVSNEVGLGIVPDNKLARNFRDIAGKANMIAAEKSDEVFFMSAGLAVKIK